MNVKDSQKFGIKGMHRLTLCSLEDPRALKIQERITQLLADGRRKIEKWSELQAMIQELKRLTFQHELLIENIIPTAGRSVIARWLIGDNTYDADDGINYTSLGDDNTAPANGDTVLGNEVYRKATASVSRANNVAYVAAFYTGTEVTGTIEECGLHIDGTASADTGQLLSHFLTGGLTKTSIQTLTVESELTIS